LYYIVIMNIIKSGSDIIKTLPSGETFNVESLDTWFSLTPNQRVYLNKYMDSLGQVEMSRIFSGITKSELAEWDKDNSFVAAKETIDLLFTEGLSALDYMEAITNGKIRGRVLQARRAKGYEPKETNKNQLVINAPQGGLAGILGALATKSD
jgi:hypothetical protein